MKELWMCFFLSLLLSACNKTADSEQAQQDASVAKNTLSADTSAAAASDTLLQEVVEITLRALGNTLEEVRYDQQELKVKAGAHVKLKLVNEGAEQSMIHNVIFTHPNKYKLVATEGAKLGSQSNYTPLDSALIIAASPMALPGQTVELEFEAPMEPGEYDFVCSYPEHFQRMHGKLIVH